ncbi:MAG TPA: hypothetical protein VFP34_00215, partial [Microlunatus sp.]|nr:hypothetical protein [Microlunatus sp.]
SLGGVRAVAGSWNDVRALAAPRVVRWQRSKTSGKYPLPGASGTNQYAKSDIAAWLAFRAKNPEMTTRDLSEVLGVPESTLRYHLEP